MGYKNFEIEKFLGFGGPIGVPLFWGLRTPKRHIYDISANNPCFLRANLMFYGVPKLRKSHFFEPFPPTRKKPEFVTTGIN